MSIRSLFEGATSGNQLSKGIICDGNILTDSILSNKTNTVNINTNTEIKSLTIKDILKVETTPMISNGNLLRIDKNGNIGIKSNSFDSMINIDTNFDSSFIYRTIPIQFQYKMQNGKRFLNRPESDIYEYGFTVEELNAVNTNICNGDNIDFIKLIAPIIKCLKEQKDEINRLSNLVSRLSRQPN